MFEVSAWSASVESSLFGLSIAAFSLCECTWPFPGVCMRWGDGESSLLSLLIRALILWVQGPTLMTSLNLNYFFGGLISKYSHPWGKGFDD